MVMKDWVLPILIGIVAAIALISILYNNPTVKQAFADLGALMQLNASRPQIIPILYQPFEDSGALLQLTASHNNSNNYKNDYKKYPQQNIMPTHYKESFSDIGSLAQLQDSNIYDAKIWKPLPTQCASQNNSIDANHILNRNDIPNYYPQVTLN